MSRLQKLKAALEQEKEQLQQAKSAILKHLKVLQVKYNQGYTGMGSIKLTYNTTYSPSSPGQAEEVTIRRLIQAHHGPEQSVVEVNGATAAESSCQPCPPLELNLDLTHAMSTSSGGRGEEEEEEEEEEEDYEEEDGDL